MKIKDTIYFDHQATTPVDQGVLAKMMPFFTETFGNPHSSDHCLGWESFRAVENAAEDVARLIGADANEIVFTSGATESNNLGLLGLARRAAEGKRKRILVSAIEHKSVLAVARVLQTHYGYAVQQIPVDSEGYVITSALEDTLDDDVLVVSIMAVNNEIGSIQDIETISNLVKNSGALYHCDASQAPTAKNIRLIARAADLLSLSSHKMYGPKGIGAIYVRHDLKKELEPLIYGGNQQDGLRSGTVPVPLCVGIGAAANLFVTDDVEEKRIGLRNRRNRFVSKLSALPWEIRVNTPIEKECHPGNANIQFVGFSAHDILSALQPRLAASTGSACTSGIPEPSHVLKAMGLDTMAAESSIRFSLGFHTSDNDIEEAIYIIEETLRSLTRTGIYLNA